MERLRTKQIYEFSVRRKKYFFDSDTLIVGELDSVSSEIVNTLKEAEQTNAEIVERLTPAYPRESVAEAIEELQQIGIVSTNHNRAKKSPTKTEIPASNLTALTLHVANDCNLRCSYCFGEGGSYGEEKCLMDWQTAKNSVDFLVKQSGRSKELSLVFFGGEPLINFPIIRKTVEYCQELENQADKKFSYSITTNGTMFNGGNVDFIKKNGFSVLVSLDGTKEIHNRYRVFPTGKGSYDVIVKKLEKYFNMETVSVRSTLPYDCFDLEGSVMNLRTLGIRRVHFELVDGSYNIDRIMKAYLPEIKRSFHTVASQYEKWLSSDVSFVVRNFMEFMKKIHLREGKIHGCGAGKGFISVSAKGVLYPCHRVVGNRIFEMGDVYKGLVKKSEQVFNLKPVNEIIHCKSCVAKHLCGGGCPSSNFAENNDINVPSQVRCEFTPHIVKLALVLYVKFKDNKKFDKYFRKK